WVGCRKGMRTTSPGGPVGFGWNISVAQKFPERSNVQAVAVVRPVAHSVGTVGKLAFGFTFQTLALPPSGLAKLARRFSVATYSIPSGPSAIQVGVASRNGASVSLG